MKKLLSAIIVVTMLIGAMGTTAFASTIDGIYDYDDTIANTIKIDFVNVDETVEGQITADIQLSAYDSSDAPVAINELNTVDLTFGLNVETAGAEIAYEISTVAGIEINNVEGDRYEFHYKAGNDAAANEIVIGKVKLSGYGTFDFFVADAATNLVTATTVTNNIVTYFTPEGDIDTTPETEGMLDLNDVDNDDATDTDGDTPDDLSDKTIAIATRNLDIVVAFPNVVNHQAADYQNMMVKVTGGLAVVPELILGSEGKAATPTDDTDDVEYGAEKSDYTIVAATDLLVEFKDGTGEEIVNGYKIALELPMNTNYTIEVTGDGYRTARYNVVLTEDKTVQFWNNVMEATTAMEIATKDALDPADNVVNTETTNTINFLAGDIVEDNNINIYDLSAVVSYFNKDLDETGATLEDLDFVKYDLNRDGIIDSKDVAYVLVSWGN